ncbi:acetyltransferase [Streptococcus parauberis]|nr:acetyltransferase [Streptococcus parauberis]UWM91928.1 acetyltransferase [Streptococcus parauberis]WEM63881.1 acetyltransferase [Streptococcus parauberis]GAJ61752.1 sugar O-acyltransferase, sialic acid O-acetyltransferase NeuD family protein [Streptococcus parauberis]
MNKLVIIGASGHGKVVAEIAKLSGYNDIIFLDDYSNEKLCSGYPVVGKVSEIVNFKNEDVFIAIGSSAVREKIAKHLKDHKIVSLIHPAAVVSEKAKIGKGSVIMAGAVVNPDTEIGEFCIVNTCSSVDHDCIIGDFSHVSVGSHVAGTVTVGSHVWIGAGATIINNIETHNNICIGAGATVINNLVDSGTYVGVPVRRIK